MFLKKAAVITLSSFILSACTSTPSPETQAKITNLESELVSIKEQSEQDKNTLNDAQLQLEQSQSKVDELTKALADTQKEIVDTKKALEQKGGDVMVETPSKQDSYLDKTVLGQAEWIYISKAKQNFKARIDTGATTSSINAVDMQRFERDGKKWVRFNITHGEGGKEQLIEAPIVRIAKIVQSSKPGEETERPVVKLHVRIGDVVQQSEFTLANRQHMEYPVLIGRTFMKDVVLVDISQDYIHPKYQATNKK